MSGKKRKNKKKKNKRFDLNVCNLDYRRLSDTIVKANEILGEKENKEKRINKEIEAERKNNCNNRLQNMFKLLWFFGVVFCLGASFVLTGIELGFIMKLFSAFFMGSGLFIMVSICLYIVAELFIFSNSEIAKNKVIIEIAENGYVSAVKKITISMVLLIVILLSIGFFGNDISNFFIFKIFSNDNILIFIKTVSALTFIFCFIISIRLIICYIKNEKISNLKNNWGNKILNFVSLMLNYVLSYLSFISIAVYIVQNIK